MGWVNVFHCEWNPFGQRVLKYYWPHAKSYADITRTDFTIHRGTIDILTGGFPCQPYSTAGKRKGKADERHLWPEMLRAIREIAPRYIVGENVLGLVNWDGGMVFDEVQTDLESAGYEVATVVIPAAAVNAPHGRDRVWFVAHSKSKSSEWMRLEQHQFSYEKQGQFGRNGSKMGNWFTANANGKRLEEQATNRSMDGEQRFAFDSEQVGKYWEAFPTQPPICGGDDGLPRELDGITFSKWRNESIKAYGNAIVPQVAFEIFKVIQAIEQS
jgi:DNA (cytosine-5)-methyltransferase 1